MTELHIDIETYSECDLKAEGVFRYAHHPSTELLVMCYAFGDEPVQQWLPGQPKPERVLDHIRSGGIIKAFNAQFERVVLNGVDWCDGYRITIEQTRCVMAKARVHGLPGSLGEAAKAFGTYAKDEGGKAGMLQLSKPRTGKIKRYTPENSPEKFAALYSYCADDVRAEYALDKALPDLTDRELSVYQLDQRINERGVLTDRPSIENAVYVRDQYKLRLAEECKKLTGCSPSQTAKLAEWVRANGYPQLQDLQAPTVVEALEDANCPAEIRNVLRIYSTYAGKAASKFDAMLRAAGDDDRLRGLFMFYGAGPGRWTSKIVQLQNMLRSLIKPRDVEIAIDALRERSLNWLRWLYPMLDVMKVIASCTRGMLVAAAGKDLISVDFSQIESRIQAWLAGAEWKLDFFRSNSKYKVYHKTGAMMFGCPMSEVVDKGADQKYTAAKIGELACGYQGWAAAIAKMARQNGMKLSIDPEEIASRWRDANPEQVQVWADLEEAAKWAVKNPGKAYAIPNKKIVFKVVDRWLCMRLPSGRRLYYLDPEIAQKDSAQYAAGDVTYMGVNTLTRRWERVGGYGGKWLQNACEGIGRDLLVNGLLTSEAAGYTTVMSAHDEGTFEVPREFGSLAEVSELMTTPLAWAEGLPVKASGWRGRRYRKDG